MPVISSRLTTDDVTKQHLLEIILSLASDGIIPFEKVDHITMQDTVADMVSELGAISIDARISFLELLDELRTAQVTQSFMKMEIVELENVIALAAKALEELLSDPKQDDALESATIAFVDNLLNLGPFKMDFNDKIFVEDTAEIDMSTIKQLMRASIAAWIDEKQNLKITL